MRVIYHLDMFRCKSALTAVYNVIKPGGKYIPCIYRYEKQVYDAAVLFEASHCFILNRGTGQEQVLVVILIIHLFMLVMPSAIVSKSDQ